MAKKPLYINTQLLAVKGQICNLNVTVIIMIELVITY